MPLAAHRLQLPVGNRGTEGLPDLHLLWLWRCRCVTEKCLERLSSSSAHTADSSRASRRGSLPFCHFKVDSSRLVHFSGVFRQFLARCTPVAVEVHALRFMLLCVTPGYGVARCPSRVSQRLLQALLTLCVCHATRLRLSQLSSGRVELENYAALPSTRELPSTLNG